MDISRITEQLYIAALPRSRDAGELAELHFALILGMNWMPPAPEFTRPPFNLLRIPTVDSPLAPIPIRLLRQGVTAALPYLAEGGRVLVHCRAGRHRSVAMAACILIATGMSADEAMSLIVAKRPVADPHIFYIESRIRKFEREWLAEHPGRP